MTSRARSLSLYLGAERQEPGRSDKNRSLPRSDHAGERDCREGAFRQEGLYPVYAPAARRSERRRQEGLDREAPGGHLRERVYVSFEQPTKMDVIVNMKTAKMLGLTIPLAILLRADRIIQ